MNPESASAVALPLPARAITVTIDTPGSVDGQALADLQTIAREELPSHAQIDFKGESRDYRQAGTALRVQASQASASYQLWVRRVPDVDWQPPGGGAADGTGVPVGMLQAQAPFAGVAVWRYADQNFNPLSDLPAGEIRRRHPGRYRHGRRRCGSTFGLEALRRLAGGAHGPVLAAAEAVEKGFGSFRQRHPHSEVHAPYFEGRAGCAPP